MGRKRRQRSTAIRKRIEKKAREDEKARRRAMKAGRRKDVVFEVYVPRESAEACSKAIGDLEQRLKAAPIRGWTTDDLSGEGGLAWLGNTLKESLAAEPDSGSLMVEVLGEAKRALLDKLTAIEMAAPGLQLDWEAGFPILARALSHAQERPEEEEEEDEG